MKVVLLGAATIDGRSGPVWDLLRDLLTSLGPQDVLVHSGGRDGLGSMVDSIVRRAKGMERRRLPKVEVQVPEIGRYDLDDALRRNAMIMLHVHMPQVAVYVGEGLDGEAAPLLELAHLYPKVIVYEASEFVAQHGRRA